MNINNQPVRIRQQKSRILRHIIYIQHHPRHIVRELCRPYLLQEPIIRHRKALPHQLLRQPSPMQIKINPVRIRHPSRLISHIIPEIDRHPRISRSRPMPNPRNLRQPPTPPRSSLPATRNIRNPNTRSPSIHLSKPNPIQLSIHRSRNPTPLSIRSRSPSRTTNNRSTTPTSNRSSPQRTNPRTFVRRTRTNTLGTPS